MKKLLFGVLFLIIILLGAALIAPSFIDWNGYKTRAVKEIKTQTGLDLVLAGDVNFAILPFPKLVAESVTINSPHQEKYDQVASFDNLSVAVKLVPLLQGQVKVESVTITRPIISVEKLQNGTLSFQTEQLKSKDTAQNNNAQIALPDISLENITIKDGELMYFDHASKSETKLQNINTDVSALSLLGPYKAKGSFFFSGNALNFDIKTDRFNPETNLITPDATIAFQPSGTKARYNGVLSIGDNISLQGQAELSIPDLAEFVSGEGQGKSFDIKGLITADSKEASFKNLTIKVGEQELLGALKAQIEPLNYNISLKTKDALNLKQALGNSIPFSSAEFDLSLSGNEKNFEFSTKKLIIDNSKLSVKGRANEITEKRAKVELDVSIDKINLDKITDQSTSASSLSQKSSPKEILKMAALPIDLGLNISADSIIFDKQEIKGLNFTAQFSENMLNIQGLSIESAPGEKLKLTSKIQSLDKDPAIVSYIDLTTSNLSNTLKKLSIESPELPQGLKSINLKTKLNGSLDRLDVTANINALDAEIIAKGKLNSPLESASIQNLVLQIKHSNMAKAVEAFTNIPISDKNLSKPLDFYTEIDQKGKTYNLTNIKGDLSGTSIEGDLSINLALSKPNIKGDLEFGKLALTALAEKKKATSKERWSKDPIDVTGMHAANVDIKLKAASINYGGWPLQNPNLHIKLKDGNLDITDLNAKIFGGSINANIKAQTNAEPRQPIYFESISSFKNADIGKLAKSLIGTQLVKLSGTGDVDINVKSSGASVAALIYDLSGRGSVNGKDIILEGVDVTRFARALSDESKLGDSITSLWKASTQGGRSEFHMLDGNFTIKEGIVSLNAINLDGEQSALETNGTIDLPKWYLNTKHKITVKGTEENPSDVPPFEMTFKGSLDNPTQTFGKGLLEDYLNRKIKRKFNKLLSDKFGVPVPSNDNKPQTEEQSGDESAPAQEEQPQEEAPQSIEDAAEEAIKDVLKGLLR